MKKIIANSQKVETIEIDEVLSKFDYYQQYIVYLTAGATEVGILRVYGTVGFRYFSEIMNSSQLDLKFEDTTIKASIAKVMRAGRALYLLDSLAELCAFYVQSVQDHTDA